MITRWGVVRYEVVRETCFVTRESRVNGGLAWKAASSRRGEVSSNTGSECSQPAVLPLHYAATSSHTSGHSCHTHTFNTFNTIP